MLLLNQAAEDGFFADGEHYRGGRYQRQCRFAVSVLVPQHAIADNAENFAEYYH